MNFEVPEPANPAFFSLDTLLGSIRPSAASESRAALRRGDHVLLSWEQLLRDGLTIDELFKCHPSSFVAWVRTEKGSPVTWGEVMAEFGKQLTAQKLLEGWGDKLCPATANVMGINADALDRLGLDEAVVAALKWAPEKWKLLFGLVPILGEASQKPQPLQPQAPITPSRPAPVALGSAQPRKLAPLTFVLKL